MKYGNFKVFCLVLLAGVAFVAFGNDPTDPTVNFESRILETFDNTENSLYVWHKDASRFAVGKDAADKDNKAFAGLGLESGDFFPKLDYFEIWPQVLFRNNPDKKELRSLGIWGKFKRMGFNWIDIYPTLKSEGDNASPYEIPIPGRVRYIDMWVWGMGLNFNIEVYLRDQQGVVHTIYLGSLDYQGWRNLKAVVPVTVPQRRRILIDPRTSNILNANERNSVYLKFVKFRIWTTPREAVGDFYVYLDQFKVLTDIFETLYDGDDMTNPDWIREHWGSSDGSSAKAAN